MTAHEHDTSMLRIRKKKSHIINTLKIPFLPCQIVGDKHPSVIWIVYMLIVM